MDSITEVVVEHQLIILIPAMVLVDGVVVETEAVLHLLVLSVAMMLLIIHLVLIQVLQVYHKLIEMIMDMVWELEHLVYDN